MPGTSTDLIHTTIFTDRYYYPHFQMRQLNSGGIKKLAQGQKLISRDFDALPDTKVRILSSNAE